MGPKAPQHGVAHPMLTDKTQQLAALIYESVVAKDDINLRRTLNVAIDKRQRVGKIEVIRIEPPNPLTRCHT